MGMPGKIPCAFGCRRSAIRAVLVELEEDELHANMAFGSVLMVIAAGFGAEAINMAAALRAADGHLSGSLAQGPFETLEFNDFVNRVRFPSRWTCSARNSSAAVSLTGQCSAQFCGRMCSIGYPRRGVCRGHSVQPRQSRGHWCAGAAPKPLPCPGAGARIERPIQARLL